MQLHREGLVVLSALALAFYHVRNKSSKRETEKEGEETHGEEKNGTYH